MANVITKYLPLPGFRMISATHLNDWAKQINDAFNGVTSIVLKGVFNGTVGATTPAAGTFTFIGESSAVALTAAGTTRADALALTAATNVLGTVASGTGVVLPAASSVPIGTVIYVYNDGANVAKVYAAGSDTIDGTAGATGVSLTNALRCQYQVTVAATWKSAKLGATST